MEGEFVSDIVAARCFAQEAGGSSRFVWMRPPEGVFPVGACIGSLTGMGATYGLGILGGMTDEETPKAFAIKVLRAIATFAKAPLRDRLPDGEIVEVSAEGEVVV